MDIELEPQVGERIQALCEEGDQLADEELYPEAREKYIEALKLLPDPKNNWEASTWIYVAIGDTYFFSDNFREMLDYFENAVQCPGGLGNPFIHLRLGQAYFEHNNLKKSADELTRAYMGAGVDIFIDDDPKYLAFLETKIEM